MNLIQEIFKTQKEGVEWKSLGEVAILLNGYNFKAEKYSKEGIRVIRISDVQKGNISDKDIKFYPFEERENFKKFLLQEGDLLISLTGNVGRVAMVTKNILPAGVNQRVACIRGDEKIILNKFLFYYFGQDEFENLAMKNATGGGQKNLSTNWLLEQKIPIPPLHIQEEIVRILDNFTELEKELEKELMVRKRQYDHYKNLMLSFIPPEGICSVYIKPFEKGIFDNDSVKWVKITDVFDLRNGYTPSKVVKEYWENGNIPWFRMEDLRQNGSILYDSVQHITIDGVKGGKLFPADSIIMATTATIGEYALIRVPSLANQQFTFFTKKGIASSGESAIQKLSSKVSSISSSPLSSSYDIDMKYFYHYCYLLGKWCKDNVSFSSFASVNMQDLKKLYIPIPSQEIQQKIVKALDMFDVLVNDLTKGLPKEIELHKKQYEYYRNLLLDFKEK